MSGEEELYNYYFRDELLSHMSEHFDMRKSISALISSARDKSASQIDAVARELLGGYLDKLSGSLVQSQKDSMERTGEVVYQVAEKTGLKFPSIPQRLLELGFMGTRPLDKLSVVESTSKSLVLRISNCDTYVNLRDQLGEAKAKDLPCRYGCLANSKELFDRLEIAVKCQRTAKMSEKGYCEFAFQSD